MTLFPIIQPEAAGSAATEYPLYREVQWDRERNAAVWENGNPVFVTGLDAVLSWAYRALQAPRLRWPVYSADYGHELEDAVGKAYSKELRAAEAARAVRECLTVNPYITAVKDVDVEFSTGTLHIAGTLVTRYGEVTVDV